MTVVSQIFSSRSLSLSTPPFSTLSPKVQFSNCDVGDNGYPVLNVGPIKIGSRVLLAKKKKGENIGVEETFIHMVAI
jgi:hypothetical protein